MSRKQPLGGKPDGRTKPPPSPPPPTAGPFKKLARLEAKLVFACGALHGIEECMKLLSVDFGDATQHLAVLRNAATRVREKAEKAWTEAQ